MHRCPPPARHPCCRRWSPPHGWRRRTAAAGARVPPLVSRPAGSGADRGHLASGPSERSAAGPRWAALLTLAVVVVPRSGRLHSSENLLVRRDPGPYGLVGSWVARHGTIEMPSGAAVFGHLPGIAFNSPAFYGRHGDLIQPQFMSGLPVTLAPASWIGGLSWLLKANAVIGGFALLAFAGFVARAVGPRAAPFATLVLALAYPETHAFRSPYSEPLTQLMVFGGVCLLWDAGRTRPKAVALAGLVLGLTTAVRVDALADLLPLAAVIVVYVLSGRARDARALTGGLLGGVAVGAADGFLLHYAYIHDTRHELRLVGIALAVVVVGVLLAVRAGRRLRQRDLQEARQRLGATAVVAVPLIAVLAYAVRPYVDHPHSPASDHTADEVGRLQALAHLTLDPHRTYAEESLRWLGWWVGAPAILLAAVGRDSSCADGPRAETSSCFRSWARGWPWRCWCCGGPRSRRTTRGPTAGSYRSCCRSW